ncbi:MAG: hypothetical protein LAP87_11890 [Acidobacteriia bacterium]|nr:hypothetical protein [Terriglobia bacterium]
MDVERTIAFILEHQAKLSVHQEKAAELHDREMAGIRDQLRRAVELSVREARNERKRRQEADARLQESDSRLEAMIDRIGQKLEGLIDALRHGGNGAH